jgi:hypothetical protein
MFEYIRNLVNNDDFELWRYINQKKLDFIDIGLTPLILTNQNFCSVTNIQNSNITEIRTGSYNLNGGVSVILYNVNTNITLKIIRIENEFYSGIKTVSLNHAGYTVVETGIWNMRISGVIYEYEISSIFIDIPSDFLIVNSNSHFLRYLKEYFLYNYYTFDYI